MRRFKEKLSKSSNCLRRCGACLKRSWASPPGRIPASSESVVKRIRRELDVLYARWQLWEELFGASQLRMDLLNDRAVTFFGLIWESLMDDITMGLCRLTDPAGRGGRNLSLGRLVLDAQATGDEEFVRILRARQKIATRRTRAFRKHRNKRIAHLCLDSALKSSEYPLPGISRAMFDDALESIGDFLGEYSGRLTGADLGFSKSMVMPGGARDLVEELKKAVEFDLMVERDEVPIDKAYGGRFSDA